MRQTIAVSMLILVLTPALVSMAPCDVKSRSSTSSLPEALSKQRESRILNAENSLIESLANAVENNKHTDVLLAYDCLGLSAEQTATVKRLADSRRKIDPALQVAVLAARLQQMRLKLYRKDWDDAEMHAAITAAYAAEAARDLRTWMYYGEVASVLTAEQLTKFKQRIHDGCGTTYFRVPQFRPSPLDLQSAELAQKIGLSESERESIGSIVMGYLPKFRELSETCQKRGEELDAMLKKQDWKEDEVSELLCAGIYVKSRAAFEKAKAERAVLQALTPDRLIAWWLYEDGSENVTTSASAR